MPTCTFFGHRECPEAIRPKLRAVVTELIEGRGVELFYVGQQGGFDAMAWAVLRELAGERPHIRYAVVLEHMPGRRELWERLDYTETLLPEGIESVYPRYAIAWRNDWMLRRADYVVTYITHPWGGAAQYAEKARRQGKTVLNLAQKYPVRDNA